MCMGMEFWFGDLALTLELCLRAVSQFKINSAEKESKPNLNFSHSHKDVTYRQVSQSPVFEPISPIILPAAASLSLLERFCLGIRECVTSDSYNLEK